MLEPGYLQMENGYAIDDEGTVIVAVRSEIPQGNCHSLLLLL
jgi:hypothetical protein